MPNSMSTLNTDRVGRLTPGPRNSGRYCRTCKCRRLLHLPAISGFRTYRTRTGPARTPANSAGERE